MMHEPGCSCDDCFLSDQIRFVNLNKENSSEEKYILRLCKIFIINCIFSLVFDYFNTNEVSNLYSMKSFSFDGKLPINKSNIKFGKEDLTFFFSKNIYRHIDLFTFNSTLKNLKKYFLTKGLRLNRKNDEIEIIFETLQTIHDAVKILEKNSTTKSQQDYDEDEPGSCK